MMARLRRGRRRARRRRARRGVSDGAHDCARDRPRARLLAVLAEDPPELGLVGGVHDLAGPAARPIRMSSGASARKLTRARRRRAAWSSRRGRAGRVGAVPAEAAGLVDRRERAPRGGGRDRLARESRLASRARRGRDRAPSSVASGAAASSAAAWPPSPSVASTRRAPGRGRSPPTTCPTNTGTWAAPTGPMSVPSVAIGGPSPRTAAALAALTPRLLALADRRAVHQLRQVTYKSSAPRTSGSSKIFSSCSSVRCHVSRSHILNMSI